MGRQGMAVLTKFEKSITTEFFMKIHFEIYWYATLKPVFEGVLKP